MGTSETTSLCNTNILKVSWKAEHTQEHINTVYMSSWQFFMKTLFSTGSKKEREVYEKAGRRVTDVLSDSSEPGRLQLSIKHAKPVFGTDFDVIIEVWTIHAAAKWVDELNLNSWHSLSVSRWRMKETRMLTSSWPCWLRLLLTALSIGGTARGRPPLWWCLLTKVSSLDELWHVTK